MYVSVVVIYVISRKINTRGRSEVVRTPQFLRTGPTNANINKSHEFRVLHSFGFVASTWKHEGMVPQRIKPEVANCHSVFECNHVNQEMIGV